MLRPSLFLLSGSLSLSFSFALSRYLGPETRRESSSHQATGLNKIYLARSRLSMEFRRIPADRRPSYTNAGAPTPARATPVCSDKERSLHSARHRESTNADARGCPRAFKRNVAMRSNRTFFSPPHLVLLLAALYITVFIYFYILFFFISLCLHYFCPYVRARVYSCSRAFYLFASPLNGRAHQRANRSGVSR